LALAGFLAFEQREQDAHRAEDARREIGDRDTARTGPWPGSPVIDISPPMPCAI
jgi:hypothetical protein